MASQAPRRELHHRRRLRMPAQNELGNLLAATALSNSLGESSPIFPSHALRPPVCSSLLPSALAVAAAVRRSTHSAPPSPQLPGLAAGRATRSVCREQQPALETVRPKTPNPQASMPRYPALLARRSRLQCVDLRSRQRHLPHKNPPPLLLSSHHSPGMLVCPNESLCPDARPSRILPRPLLTTDFLPPVLSSSRKSTCLPRRSPKCSKRQSQPVIR